MATLRQKLRGQRVADGEASRKQVAERLKIARDALGMTQVKFADLAGVSPQAYNNWERGRQRPDLDQAIALCRAHGVTLDWIYRGTLAGLRYEVHDAAAKALRSNKA